MTTIDTKLDYECIHSGQKRAYGDTFKEYVVKSDLHETDVEQLCNIEFGCTLTKARWLSEDSSADKYFRTHYTFEKHREGEYLYITCYPYTG